MYGVGYGGMVLRWHSDEGCKNRGGNDKNRGRGITELIIPSR